MQTNINRVDPDDDRRSNGHCGTHGDYNGRELRCPTCTAQKQSAVAQSHALTQLDTLCREHGLPTYSHLLAVAETATPVLLSKYMHSTSKTFAQIAEEYVDTMLRSEPVDEQERRLR